MAWHETAVHSLLAHWRYGSAAIRDATERVALMKWSQYYASHYGEKIVASLKLQCFCKEIYECE